ncbi:30S ribosomal protein S8 [Candidatus Woesearchaeota archaeon]|nr:30S ribosomal protein S8 [Candidatus Woesearchaeota archaeon]
MLNDPLANALSLIMNAERSGKKECLVKPTSKLIVKVLEVMQNAHLLGEAKTVEDGRGNLLRVNLLGKINQCGAIKPRYPITKQEYVRFEKRFLPAKDFGMLIVTTSGGIMTHYEAKQKGLGGKLLAYAY